MVAKTLSPPEGTEKFQRAINAELGRSMKGWLKSKKRSKLLLDEIHKEIFELGPPNPPGKPTGRRRYIQKLTHHFTEILRALDTMRDIEFYAGRFPYRRAVIAKHRHLQFHVEAFLHELYILQLRLTQLLTFIERQHRKDPRLPGIEAGCEVLNDFVLGSFRRGVLLRSNHVHQARLSDTKIERLQAISFYTMMPNKRIRRAFEAFYESEYRKTRKLWRRWIAGTIGEVQKILDAYFDQVFTLVFDEWGRPTFPSRLKF